jgi:hypothetical protein
VRHNALLVHVKVLALGELLRKDILMTLSTTLLRFVLAGLGIFIFVKGVQFTRDSFRRFHEEEERQGVRTTFEMVDMLASFIVPTHVTKAHLVGNILAMSLGIWLTYVGLLGGLELR